MSEELGSVSGHPVEPPRAAKRPPPLEQSANSSPPSCSPVLPVCSKASPVAPTVAPICAWSANHAGASSSRNIAGGGTYLPPGDKPGDPLATLLVIAGDCLLGRQPCSPLRALPPLVEQGLSVGLKMLEGHRCVVICTGGHHLSQSLMEAFVSRVQGGLDSFGPGRSVEALFKERAAPYGSLFESALLVKALAKRQRSNVRFGSVRIITADYFADQILRVYKCCFSDWRVLINDGRGRGGRDQTLDIQAIRVIPDVEDQDLTQRAALLDQAWFARALQESSAHPSWPGTNAAPLSAIDEPSRKRQST
ncbi:MAG: hypothetical protein SGPRY_000002 [Prymnesium sp.]